MGPAIRYSLLIFFLCGLLYPLGMTALGQAFFPQEANGSLIHNAKGEITGSSLLAQPFTRPEYFHPRPSVNNYDAANSGGSNLGATSQKLIERVQQDAEAYRKNEEAGAVPVDAVTTSASGLDPHISLANAMNQAPRIAKARGKSLQEVQATVQGMQEKPVLKVFGEPSVNVLQLNLALDRAQHGT